MGTSLLEEAIVDAQKLRELAEQTAKNKLIDAVMPQIRELVNRRILGESLEKCESDKSLNEDDYQNESEIALEESDYKDDESEAEDNDEDNENLVEALYEFAEKQDNIDRLKEQADKIFESVKKLKTINEVNPRALYFNKGESARKIMTLTEQAIDLRSKIDNYKVLNNGTVKLKINESLKELKTMAKHNRGLFDFLFENDNKQNLREASLALEISDEEREEVGEDAMDKLESILADAGIDIVDLGLDEDFDMEEGVEDDEDMEMEGFDMDDTGMDEAMEDDLDEELEMDEDLEESSLYGLDEAAIRREVRRMRRISEAAADAVDQFGGGEAKGDVFVDIREEDLINVLADELGKYQHNVGMPRVGKLKEARARKQAIAKRRARKQLAENYRKAKAEAVHAKRRNAAMKKQLQEMNLFNAKLLFANKLLQNKTLSETQQRKIVEALDEAKTVKEAKVLYEGLSKAILAKTSKSKTLNESVARNAGSASKPTRSASPASVGDTNRWAVLAGLN